jgi:hypothetical protein
MPPLLKIMLVATLPIVAPCAHNPFRRRRGWRLLRWFANRLRQAPSLPRMRAWQDAGGHSFFIERPEFLARLRLVKWFNT